MGILEILVGVALAALLIAEPDLREPLPVGVTGLLFVSGVVLVRNARRSARYGSLPLVFADDHVLLPRLRAGQSVRVAYGEVRAVRWAPFPRLRLRIFVRTTRGDFWLHRAWLPEG